MICIPFQKTWTCLCLNLYLRNSPCCQPPPFQKTRCTTSVPVSEKFTIRTICIYQSSSNIQLSKTFEEMYSTIPNIKSHICQFHKYSTYLRIAIYIQSLKRHRTIPNMPNIWKVQQLCNLHPFLSFPRAGDQFWGAPSFENSLKLSSFETDPDRYPPHSRCGNQVFQIVILQNVEFETDLLHQNPSASKWNRSALLNWENINVYILSIPKLQQ